MLNTAKLEALAKANVDLKLVQLESMEGEECFVKKFTMGDTLAFRHLNEDETVMSMIQIGVVDADCNPLFPTIEAVAGMPVNLVTELLGHVSEHNVGADVEDQAKKS